METIRYEFCDGTVSEIEVSNELYVICEEMVREEKRNHKRETRRHVSLDYLKGLGLGIEALESDPLITLIRKEELTELELRLSQLKDSLSQLLPKQRTLVEKVFFKGATLTSIAKEENVSQPAISQRLATALKKVKKLL